MQEAAKGWPRVARSDERIACHYCDCLHDPLPLAEKEAAKCRNCGETLYQHLPRSLQRATSFTCAAFILMMIVLVFPFMSIKLQGRPSSMTMWTCLLNVWRDGAPLLAVVTGAAVVVFPALLMILLFRTTVPLLFGRAGWGSEQSFRFLLWLKEWIMVEVFFLGVLVSLVKLFAIADVKLGIGFWAIGGVMVLLAAALQSLDKSEFWDRIESCRERERGKVGVR